VISSSLAMSGGMSEMLSVTNLTTMISSWQCSRY
jgi:hypothetical protein